MSPGFATRGNNCCIRQVVVKRVGFSAIFFALSLSAGHLLSYAWLPLQLKYGVPLSSTGANPGKPRLYVTLHPNGRSVRSLYKMYYIAAAAAFEALPYFSLWVERFAIGDLGRSDIAAANSIVAHVAFGGTRGVTLTTLAVFPFWRSSKSFSF